MLIFGQECKFLYKMYLCHRLAKFEDNRMIQTTVGQIVSFLTKWRELF